MRQVLEVELGYSPQTLDLKIIHCMVTAWELELNVGLESPTHTFGVVVTCLGINSLRVEVRL